MRKSAIVLSLKNSSRPFIFSVYDPSFRDGKEAMQVFMHPQTGLILKTRGTKDGFMSWVDTLHASLHLGKKGEWLLGFFALVFLLSIVTGINYVPAKLMECTNV